MIASSVINQTQDSNANFSRSALSIRALHGEAWHRSMERSIASRRQAVHGGASARRPLRVTRVVSA